jgi:hypothetical protein
VLFARVLLGNLGIGLEEIGVVGVLDDARTLAALDQHLDRAVGQLEQLQDRAHRAHRIDIGRARIVLRGVPLGDQEDLRVVFLHDLERADGFLSAHEKREDHVREDHNIPQRKNGK